LKSTPLERTVQTPSQTEPFVLFARPDIGASEIEAVVGVLRSGWITTGAQVRTFEEEFAGYVGAPYAIAVNSCTAALHLGLEALGVHQGDEVLTSTLTFTATAEVMVYLGARPRFVDVEPDTLNLSPHDIRERLRREYTRRSGAWHHRETGNRLAGIVPVHYAGHPCQMDAILSLAAEYEVSVLDDAAHALPAGVAGRRIGSFPCPTAFSFYATKTLTTGEGGMLCTADPKIAERARTMSLHGINRDAWNRYASDGNWAYEVVEAGYKYNLTDIAGALGRVQLARCDAMLGRREEIAARYHEAFASLEAVERPVCRPGVQHAWHLYSIRLRLSALRIDRARFIKELHARGVGASVHFIPLHQQPFYARRYGYQPADFPEAASAYRRLVSLPIYSAMSADDVETVIAAVWDVVETFQA
jgi:dTDP-4-amino-4,6-dideoxygalactose transaminase